MSINSIINNPVILAELADALNLQALSNVWEIVNIEFSDWVLSSSEGTPVVANGNFTLWANGNSRRLVSITPAGTVNQNYHSLVVSTEVQDLNMDLVSLPSSLTIPAIHLPPQGISFAIPCGVNMAGSLCETGVAFISAVPYTIETNAPGLVRVNITPSLTYVTGVNEALVIFDSMYEWTLDDTQNSPPAAPLVLLSENIESIQIE